MRRDYVERAQMTHLLLTEDGYNRGREEDGVFIHELPKEAFH